MKFVTSDLGPSFLSQLSQAHRLRLAVAYFNPDQRTLEVIKAVPEKVIVVSDRFEINDPWKLESLLGSGDVRQVPSDRDAGFLHAKVFLIERENGGRWALMGSANATHAGLFTNQEACMIFDSEVHEDIPHLAEMESWFESIRTSAIPVQFDLAKAIHRAHQQYRKVLPSPAAAEIALQPEPHIVRAEDRGMLASGGASGFWVLKTTEGSNGENFWPHFRAESVVALGWGNLDVDPSSVSSDELRRAVKRSFSDLEGTAIGARVSKISNFVRFEIGDVVLICKGYPPTSDADVHIYGIARITGPFVRDITSSWWRFKHAAAIQVIDQKVPKTLLARALARNSLMGAVHAFKISPFTALEDLLHSQLGVNIEV